MKVIKTESGLLIPSYPKTDEYILANPDWQSYCGPGREDLPKLKRRYTRFLEIKQYIDKNLSVKLWQSILYAGFKSLHIHCGQEVYTGGILIGPALDIYIENDLITDFGVLA